jgi:hypothetical protein
MTSSVTRVMRICLNHPKSIALVPTPVVLLNALAPQTIENIAFCPDRFQIRFAKSAYLLAELPLGDFYRQRYGGPMMNIAGPALHQCLDSRLSTPLAAPMALAESERRHALTILSSRTPVGQSGDGDFHVFHASLADHPLRRANVLWRGKGQYIEQVADTDRVHFRFVTRRGTDFAFADWHESLHPALEDKNSVTRHLCWRADPQRNPVWWFRRLPQRRSRTTNNLQDRWRQYRARRCMGVVADDGKLRRGYRRRPSRLRAVSPTSTP